MHEMYPKFLFILIEVHQVEHQKVWAGFLWEGSKVFL